MSTPTGHRNNKLNKDQNIILDKVDHHVSKDSPFRILGNALTYSLYNETNKNNDR